jgi:hypothetical protein
MLHIALVTAVAVLGAFVVPTVLAYRQARAGAMPASRDHTSPNVHVAPSIHVAPRVIQNASIVYTLGLVALAPLLAWGITGELWPVLLYLLAVGLGLFLLYALRRPILQFLDDALLHDRSITVHDFIARRHGRDSRVRALAAALTVFALYGLSVCVMVGLAIVLRPVFAGSGTVTDAFIAAMFLIVAACTVFAGRLGILYATQVQLGLIYFGLFAATVFLLYLQGSAVGVMPLKGVVALLLIAVVCAIVHFRRRARHVDTSIRASIAGADTPRGREPVGVRLLVRLQKILNTFVGILAMTLMVLATIVAALEIFLGGVPDIAREGLAALAAGTSASAMTLISLIVLPLLHPLVDIVNWQRLAAFARLRGGSELKNGEWAAAFKTFCVTYAIEVPLMALFIVLFGVIAGLTLTGTSVGDATGVFMTSLLALETSVATIIASLLMLGVLALAAATIGSLFAAGLCVVRSDVVPALRSRPATGGSADEGPARTPLIAGLIFGGLILVTFVVADRVSTADSAGLLGAMLGFGSAQIALAPLVLVPLLAGHTRFSTVTAPWALAVLLVGGAIAVSMTIAGLVFGQVAALSWAVPAVFVSSMLVFAIGAVAGGRQGRTASGARASD